MTVVAMRLPVHAVPAVLAGLGARFAVPHVPARLLHRPRHRLALTHHKRTRACSRTNRHRGPGSPASLSTARHAVSLMQNGDRGLTIPPPPRCAAAAGAALDQRRALASDQPQLHLAVNRPSASDKLLLPPPPAFGATTSPACSGSSAAAVLPILTSYLVVMVMAGSGRTRNRPIGQQRAAGTSRPRRCRAAPPSWA
jgi:hypothetical protein